MSLGLIHEITGRCNLRCAFCYNPWRLHEDPPAELGARENGEMLEAVLADSGAGWLTFTGGEPLLYEELGQVMTHVRRRFPAVRLGLATNGLLLPARLEGLQAAGLDYVEISLFTVEAATYAALSETDQHERPRHALALARSRGLATTAATVLRAGMEAELEDILRLAFALGADRVALNRFAPRGRGSAHAQWLAPTLEELDRLLAMADRVAGSIHLPILVTTPIEDCLLPHTRYPHLAFGPCVCGDSKWVIDPGGHLRVCELDDHLLGNLRTTPFADLARLPTVSRFRQAHRGSGCTACSSWTRCGGGCRFTPGMTGSGTAHSEDGGGRE